MSVTILISGQREVRVDGDTITVGSDASCQIALPGDERVEPQHAVIRRVAGRWMVEARGSQLIHVGDGRPAQMSWLNPGDLIRLTSSGPELAFDPPRGSNQAADSPAIRAEPTALPSRPAPVERPPVVQEVRPVAGRNAAGTDAGGRQSLFWAAGGAALLAAGTLLAVFVLWLTGSFERRSPDKSANVAGNPSAPEEDSDDLPVVSDGPAPGAGTKAAPAAAAPTGAVYLVVVSSPDGEQTYRLGSAFAVSANRLVTSGAIVAGLESLANVAPKARVVAPGSSQSFPIRAKRLHPQYQAALDEARRAQNEAENLRLDLEQTRADERLDELTEKLVAAEERRYQALERQVDFDVAVLEVDGTLSRTLPLADGGSDTLKAGSGITLAGIPFPPEEYVVDPEAEARSASVSGSVFSLGKGARDSPRRVLIRCRKDLGNANWSGAPVLDSRGRVVGVYSRPTPPPPGVDTLPEVVTHDIADVAGAASLRVGAK